MIDPNWLNATKKRDPDFNGSIHEELGFDNAICPTSGFYFIPNGVVTYEDCPVCRTPDMRVEHGKSGRGSPQHFEHCTECGDSMVIVCYDCPHCQIDAKIVEASDED